MLTNGPNPAYLPASNLPAPNILRTTNRPADPQRRILMEAYLRMRRLCRVFLYPRPLTPEPPSNSQAKLLERHRRGAEVTRPENIPRE